MGPRRSKLLFRARRVKRRLTVHRNAGKGKVNENSWKRRRAGYFIKYPLTLICPPVHSCVPWGLVCRLALVGQSALASVCGILRTSPGSSLSTRTVIRGGTMSLSLLRRIFAVTTLFALFAIITAAQIGTTDRKSVV